MKTRLTKPNRGFTIIEVMIVLAIAGLILAIVFIAVPQLQRNARDNARQNAVTRFKAELDTYASNNQGIYPFRGTPIGTQHFLLEFVDRYITQPGVEIENPTTGTQYTVAFGGGSAAVAGNRPSPTEIRVYPGMRCSGEFASTGAYVAPGAANNQKSYAVMAQLDRGGTYFCVDNG